MNAADAIFQSLAESLPALRRGVVWCLVCGRSQAVDTAKCFRDGWPECCNETMSLDSPEERRERSAGAT